ncbi:hypothetical protein, partial [Nocardia abscessus]|uniref:hypothetical protein n=1 Tax=Nocardia abscessus TaxID=120957 RepID=UPI00245900A7
PRHIFYFSAGGGFKSQMASSTGGTIDRRLVSTDIDARPTTTQRREIHPDLSRGPTFGGNRLDVAHPDGPFTEIERLLQLCFEISKLSSCYGHDRSAFRLIFLRCGKETHPHPECEINEYDPPHGGKR